MKARALATFRMGPALVRSGDIFESKEDHIRALMRNRLAEPVESRNMAHDDEPEAMETKPMPAAAETKPATPRRGGRE